MSKIFLALASCALASIYVTGSVQKGADFSGSWVLDDAPINVAAEIPRRLVVQQSFDRADVLGGPGLLKVKEIGLDWEREQSYEITDSSKPPTRSLTDVRWHGDYLRIEERERLLSGAAVSHRAQTWRFDDGGRLVIGFVFHNHREGGAEVSQTFAYRRNNQ
jgi:hypothetical protein